MEIMFEIFFYAAGPRYFFKNMASELKSLAIPTTVYTSGSQPKLLRDLFFTATWISE